MKHVLALLMPWQRTRFTPYHRLRDSEVPCPRCGQTNLQVRVSCRRTQVSCPSCKTDFDLATLFGELDDNSAMALADAMGDRPSDRI
ncbi:MAG: hypothetical protein HN348_10510 [Proteobacteria bacterium]|nr:hypothetical protein [Pseudomonadota bacterium]